MRFINQHLNHVWYSFDLCVKFQFCMINWHENKWWTMF